MRSEQSEEEGNEENEEDEEDERNADQKETLLKEQERQRKLHSMFLNHRVLEEQLRGVMSRYGVKDIDPDVLFLISDAMKQRYTNIITELISISRSSQSNSYLTNKKS